MAQTLELHTLELDSEIFSKCFSASQDRDVAEKSFTTISKSGSLDCGYAESGQPTTSG